MDEHGHPRFEWLVNREKQKGVLVYYVFDLLRLGDKDLRTEPLYRRKSLLQKLLRKKDTFRYVDHIERQGLAMYWQKIKNGTISGKNLWNFTRESRSANLHHGCDPSFDVGSGSRSGDPQVARREVKSV